MLCYTALWNVLEAHVIMSPGSNYIVDACWDVLKYGTVWELFFTI